MFKTASFSPAQPWRADTRLVPGKAAGESKPEAYPLGYVEDFDELRTELEAVFNIRHIVSSILPKNRLLNITSCAARAS